MQELKRIDVESAARMGAVSLAGVGAVIGAIIVVMALVWQSCNKMMIYGDLGTAVLGAILGYLMAILFYACIGYIGGFVGALVYNTAAARWGGVKIEIKKS
jgi:hypothetical protein